MLYFIARLYPVPASVSPAMTANTAEAQRVVIYPAGSVDSEEYATRPEAEAAAQRSAGQEKTVVVEAETSRQAGEILHTLPLEHPVPETERLLQALEAHNVSVHQARRWRLFEGARQVLDVGGPAGASLGLWEMDDEQTATNHGAQMHEQLVRDMARAPFPVTVPGWWYQRGRLIARYVDTDERVIEALREVLGPPLAEKT